MRSRCSLLLLLISAGMWFSSSQSIQAQEVAATRKAGQECHEVISTMKAAIAREPGRLILCMEDALTTQESCTCLIVREAVSYAGEDHALVGQLVLAAIRMVPSAATQIAECAMMEAPAAAPAVRAALSKELGKPAGSWLEAESRQAKAGPSQTSSPLSPQPEVATGTASGKEPSGKSPIGPLPENSADLEVASMDFAWPNVGVSGIFIAPSARSGISQRADMTSVPPSITIITIKNTPRRPVAAITQSNPD